MIGSFVLQAAQVRATWLLIGLLAGTLIMATAFAIGSVPNFGQPNRDGTTITQPGYGEGYPVPGGLAGPSWVQGGQHPGYGEGYPVHGGLAGPSSVGAGIELGPTVSRSRISIPRPAFSLSHASPPRPTQYYQDSHESYETGSISRRRHGANVEPQSTPR